MTEAQQAPKTGPIRKAVETAILSAIGAALFTVLHVPAGVILGAMTVVAVGALAGRPLGFAPPRPSRGQRRGEPIRRRTLTAA